MGQYWRNSEILNNIKSAIGCLYCDERTPVALDFHHLSDKRYAIARMKAGYSKNKLMGEIMKCEIVCSNCHRKIHAGRELSPKRESLAMIYACE